MKPISIAALAAATAIATTLLIIPRVAASEMTYTRATTTPDHIAVVSKMVGTPAQEKWLERLVQCESTGNPAAINPKDRDGTPSYGLLQFKPSTFVYFAERYRIKGTLMDANAQRAIVRKMMNDATVDWLQQFPDCVANHIGYPPKKG